MPLASDFRMCLEDSEVPSAAVLRGCPNGTETEAESPAPRFYQNSQLLIYFIWWVLSEILFVENVVLFFFFENVFLF